MSENIYKECGETKIKIRNENIIENQNVSKVKRDLVIHRRSSMRVCKCCGKFYHMSDADMAYFYDKYGTFPLKCQECRQKNRDIHPYEKENK